VLFDSGVVSRNASYTFCRYRASSELSLSEFLIDLVVDKDLLILDPNGKW
jgi:hypothetical protein